LEEGYLGELSNERLAQIESVRKLMLASEEFLSSRFAEVSSEIEVLRSNGHLVLACPDCEKQSLILGDVGDDYPACLVCGTKELDAEELADHYARRTNPMWKHPKHGPDDDLAWCEGCGRQTVAPAGEESEEQIMEMFSRVPREPGEDWELFVCLACGEPVIGYDIHHCGSCGSQYVSSNPEHTCPACHWF
jgi:ribosomal protein S27E